MQLLTAWFRRQFANPQVVYLTLLLLVGFGVVLSMGDMLLPVLASIVIAYLLEGVVAPLQHRALPRFWAVLLVFCGFMLFLVLLIFGLLPQLSRQITDLVNQLPLMISEGQQALMLLPERYPDLLSTEQVQEVMGTLRTELANLGQKVLSLSLASLVGLITILVYLVLMPLLVFFFLKDKDLILAWSTRFLPSQRDLALQIWEDVDRQIANYVRGKFWEILIVGSASFVTFRLFGLNYAVLLAVLVGLSVIIPYIGAAVVTFPVVLIAWFQWGWGPDFIWLTVSYFIIQALDGNVLVPLLFSEVVNLHPVAIIVAILVFGGFWGFWGVFFAIPLATLVQAVITSWPGPDEE
ncbi:MAG: AI-2E family transporter [Gammaproteobacteria bacterium SHHR-1]|uniref:AI-2E family transporter n=1 Tax=Magnetovirga frankeli TaxID=947516 RepID=UPI0012932A28|nr:AI-2E family transporter [gamma proteobacterium SS-5]